MSLLPLIVLVVLIIGGGFLLFQEDIKLPKFNKGPQIRRLENFPQVVYSDQAIEKQRKIITSEDELNQFLNMVDPTGILQIKDKINFEKEVVIAVTTDTQNEMDHAIKIKKVYEDKEDMKLIIQIEEWEPGENCKPDRATNIPLDIATVSKSEWEIDFEKVKKVEDCEIETSSEDTVETDTPTEDEEIVE